MAIAGSRSIRMNGVLWAWFFRLRGQSHWRRLGTGKQRGIIFKCNVVMRPGARRVRRISRLGLRSHSVPRIGVGGPHQRHAHRAHGIAIWARALLGIGGQTFGDRSAQSHVAERHLQESVFIARCHDHPGIQKAGCG